VEVGVEDAFDILDQPLVVVVDFVAGAEDAEDGAGVGPDDGPYAWGRGRLRPVGVEDDGLNVGLARGPVKRRRRTSATGTAYW